MCVFEALFLRTYTKISWELVFVSIHTFSTEKRTCYHWVNHHKIRVQKMASHGIAVEPSSMPLRPVHHIRFIRIYIFKTHVFRKSPETIEARQVILYNAFSRSPELYSNIYCL